MKKISRAVIIFVVIYFFIGILFYLLQDAILFHPKPLDKEHQFSFEQPFEEVNIDRGNRNLNFIKFKTGSTEKALYFTFTVTGEI
jgi:uncharacterized protein